MARIKLTKSAVDAAKPQAQAIELRDTVVPGFVQDHPGRRCSCSSTGRTPASERRSPWASTATDRRGPCHGAGGWPRCRGGDCAAGRRPRTDHEGVLRHLHGGLLQAAQQAQHAARLSGRHRPLHHPDHGADEGAGRGAGRGRADEEAGCRQANRTFGVLRKMFNLAEVSGLRPDGTNRAATSRCFRPQNPARDDELVRIFRHLEHGKPRDWRTTSSAGDHVELPPAAPKSARSNGAGLIWKSAASSGPTARPAAFPNP